MWARRSRNRGSIPYKWKWFPVSKASRKAVGPKRLKRPEAQSWPSSPFSANVRNEWIYAVIRLTLVQRDIFSFIWSNLQLTPMAWISRNDRCVVYKLVFHSMNRQQLITGACQHLLYGTWFCKHYGLHYFNQLRVYVPSFWFDISYNLTNYKYPFHFCFTGKYCSHWMRR